MPLPVRLELLRQRGAAERLVIQVEQLAWRERIGDLRRGAGWVMTPLRWLLRVQAGAGAPVDAGRDWVRLAVAIAPWLIMALRRRRGARTETTAAGSGAAEPGGDIVALVTMLVRLGRRMLRRRVRPDADAAGDGA